VGRTDAVARFARHELLHGAVLERVERDDREAATGTQDRHRGHEAMPQVLELVVHRDTERLEDARGRIDAARALLLDAEDETTEVVRGHERLARAAPNDRGRDAAGLRLLAVLGEDAAQLDLIPAVHDVGRREAKVWVRTHVQRARRAKAEPSLSVGELDRREAEIEEDAVDLIEAVLAGHDVANREVGADEDGASAEPCEDPPCFRERFGIDVEPEEAAGRRAPVEDGLGMASPTDRAIEEAAIFAEIKLGEYFGQKNRLMKPPTEVAKRPLVWRPAQRVVPTFITCIPRPRDP
jgi:hypothetical protein